MKIRNYIHFREEGGYFAFTKVTKYGILSLHNGRKDRTAGSRKKSALFHSPPPEENDMFWLFPEYPVEHIIYIF